MKVLNEIKVIPKNEKLFIYSLMFCLKNNVWGNYPFNVRHYVCSDGREEGLLEQKRQFSRDIARLRETYESLMGQFPNLRFEYT